MVVEWGEGRKRGVVSWVQFSFARWKDPGDWLYNNVNIVFCYCVFAFLPHDFQDLSPPNWVWTQAMATKTWNPNQLATRQFLWIYSIALQHYYKHYYNIHQSCILSPCLFNLYAEYIIWNARLDEAQAGIRIASRNNNLRNADDTTLMAESEVELKSLLMKVKEESEKAGIKLNIQKTKIMASGPITSWQIDGETMETVADFTFLGSKITVDGDCSHEI